MDINISLVPNNEKKYKVLVTHNNMVLKDKFVAKSEISNFMQERFEKDKIDFLKSLIPLFRGKRIKIKTKHKGECFVK